MPSADLRVVQGDSTNATTTHQELSDCISLWHAEPLTRRLPRRSVKAQHPNGEKCNGVGSQLSQHWQRAAERRAIYKYKNVTAICLRCHGCPSTKAPRQKPARPLGLLHPKVIGICSTFEIFCRQPGSPHVRRGIRGYLPHKYLVKAGI